MTTKTTAFPTAALAVLAVSLVAGRSEESARDHGQEAPRDVERGRYLVHHLAHCIQCHTPRDERGRLQVTDLLSGAPVPVRTPYEQMEWALRAPHIAGLPGYTDEQAVRLLMEGVTASGGPPLPPMPPFRMNEEDARAVVAYLRTVGAEGMKQPPR